MNIIRKILVWGVIGLFIGASVMPSIADTNKENNGDSDDLVEIISPSYGEVCSGNVYISWWVETFFSPWSTRTEVYCENQLIHIGSASSGSCYWNSKMMPDGSCMITVMVTADPDVDGSFRDLLGSDSVLISVQNSNDPPNACFTCSNLNPEVGQTVQFDGSCSSDSDGSITDYYWYYTIEGGGLPVTMGHGKTLSYNWDEPGVYQVTLEVTDNNDNKDQETKTINVGGGGEADLDCQGSLSWTNTKPGELVTASFSVINVGESGSQLNWKIQSFPSWGDWTLTPNSGKGLTPADGSMMVEVFVVAPDIQESTFSGEILVVNEDDSSDYETISVSLSTPRNKRMINPFSQFVKKMVQHHPCLFPIFEHVIAI